SDLPFSPIFCNSFAISILKKPWPTRTTYSYSFAILTNLSAAFFALILASRRDSQPLEYPINHKHLKITVQQAGLNFKFAIFGKALGNPVSLNKGSEIIFSLAFNSSADSIDLFRSLVMKIFAFSTISTVSE